MKQMEQTIIYGSRRPRWACYPTRYVSIEEVNVDPHRATGMSTNVARDLIKNWCATELQWATSETNNAPPLWGQVLRHVRGYLGILWVLGALRGDRSKEAFCVQCDESLMTDTDIREGRIICQVGIAPVKPSEFVFYRIHIRLQSLQKPLVAA